MTGATGYVGGRLVPRLLEAGYRVTCIVRDPGKLESRPWSGDKRVLVLRGDAADPESLTRAMQGCRYAYYLIHSMLVAGTAYRDQDRALAQAFATAAERSGIEGIVYLGGLGETGGGLSEHLASRREVEEALSSTSVPVTVLRAAMIIGSGSASFEILRYLVERLPAMITPRWVSTRAQPIAIRDALHYLVACLEHEETTGRTLDIGGPEVLSYKELMHQAAEVIGLRRRLILPVPVLTPELSSLWIHFVTPVHRDIARPLAMGLRNQVVCRNDDARRLMPHALLSPRQAMEAALGRMQLGQVETSWSDAGAIPGDPDWAGKTVFEDRRELQVDATREQVFGAISRIGGSQGWYAANLLWKLRGMLDRLVGGPGLSRGRRSSKRLAYGDALDFWRVTALQENRRLQLRAEMKLPGDAVLEFEVLDGSTANRTTLRQTARFAPRGLAGLLYWYGVLPLHNLVFGGMIRSLALSAKQEPLNGVQHA